jgi:hypothetical protein
MLPEPEGEELLLALPEGDDGELDERLDALPDGELDGEDDVADEPLEEPALSGPRSHAATPSATAIARASVVSFMRPPWLRYVEPCSKERTASGTPPAERHAPV